MLIRIALIVAIVAGLGAAALMQVKVKDRITGLTSERDDYKQRMETAQSNEASAKKKLKKTEDDLRTANKNLDETKTSLETASARATMQEKRANDIAKQMETVVRERNTAQENLAAWKATGLQPGEVQKAVDKLKTTEAERDAYAGEEAVLMRNNARLQARLDLYEKPDQNPVMREGLKGKVVAVDPKWDFVVLNVGADQGALERGVMLVNRNGKYVAKVRLASVQRNRSIANIIPQTRQADILEGDEVFY